MRRSYLKRQMCNHRIQVYYVRTTAMKKKRKIIKVAILKTILIIAYHQTTSSQLLSVNPAEKKYSKKAEHIPKNFFLNNKPHLILQYNLDKNAGKKNIKDTKYNPLDH